LPRRWKEVCNVRKLYSSCTGVRSYTTPWTEQFCVCVCHVDSQKPPELEIIITKAARNLSVKVLGIVSNTRSKN